MTRIDQVASAAAAAAREALTLSTQNKDEALEVMAQALLDEEEEIVAANERDLRRAEAEVKAGRLSGSLYKRLKLGKEKLRGVAEAVRAVRKLPDPVGVVQWEMELDQGLELQRVSCPLGVIGVIFESRPDVLPQVASLALKSGNAAILKGGSEAAQSNAALMDVTRRAIASVQGVPTELLQLVSTREDVRQMLDCHHHIDLIIPRGSKEFIRQIMEQSRIPVMGHADGVCHIYLDEAADEEKALGVVMDAKLDYPAACNAVETLLVHRGALAQLPRLCRELSAAGVELRGCERAREAVPSLAKAGEEDWRTEYLDLVLAIRVVDDLQQALDHIANYGSKHTEAIITEEEAVAEAFLRRVDAADVFVNASTRFADGFRFGLGAEVGISTSKLHARGPVGLEGLVTYKYLLRGNGHCAGDYGAGKRSFRHRQ